MTELDMKARQNLAKSKLREAQGYFNKVPSAANYRAVQHWMLEYQAAYQEMLDGRERDRFAADV